MDVCEVNGVIVDDCNFSDANRRQLLQRRTAEPTGSHHQDVRCAQPALLFDPEPRQVQVPRCAAQLLARQFSICTHHRTSSAQFARPSNVDDACAWVRVGIRPAPRARRPASTACRIASAIATGS